MGRSLRRARGIVGTTLTWGGAAAVAGGWLGAVGSLLVGHPADLLSYAAILGAGLGLLGGLTGAAFATLFTTLEGRRTLHEVSPFRSAFWGAVAGVATPYLLVFLRPDLALAEIADGVYLTAVLLGSVGSIAAAASVLVAQRTAGELGEPGADQPLPSAGASPPPLRGG